MEMDCKEEEENWEQEDDDEDDSNNNNNNNNNSSPLSSSPCTFSSSPFYPNITNTTTTTTATTCTTSLLLPTPRLLCQHCGVPNSLYTCSHCTLVRYCSISCQRIDWSKGHKSLCKAATRYQVQLSVERQKLRHFEESIEGFPIDYFTHPAYSLSFYHLLDTRPYCEVIKNYQQLCARLLSEQSCRLGITLSLELLFHSRKDEELKIRYLLPFFFLRLGMDQPAYDLMKWYAEYPSRSIRYGYDFSDPTLPFLHYWQMDRGERILHVDKPSLHHLVAEALIKFRLYSQQMDEEHFQCFILYGEKEREGEGNDWLQLIRDQSMIVNGIHACLVDSDQWRYTRPRSAEEVMQQLEELLDLADLYEPIIWQAMTNPQPLLSSSPFAGSDLMTDEETEHLQLCEVVEVGHKLWRDTPGSLDFLHAYCLLKYGSIDYDVLNSS
eukprot:gene8611-9490_t